MKIQEKPDYLIFADSAKKGEVNDFPDVSRGWGITIEQTGSKPPMEWMNGAFNRIDKNMLYLLQQGISEWSESVIYPVNAIIKHKGVLYIALAENDNVDPSKNKSKWRQLQADDFNALPAQKKNSAGTPIYEVGNNVDFENRPTVNGNYIVTVDEFSNKLNTHGYQKLPSGLIIQWGGSGALGSRVCTYPISFNNFLCAFATSNDVGGSFVSTDTNKTQNPNAQIYLTPYTSSGAKITDRLIFINWLAIGY